MRVKQYKQKNQINFKLLRGTLFRPKTKPNKKHKFKSNFKN